MTVSGNDSYFFDTMTVTFKQGSTSLSVGVIQNVEITPEVEAVELYGSDSIKRSDVIRRKLKVTVKAKFCKFHPNVIGYWQGTQNAGKDITGGTSASNTQGQMTDSNTMPLFTLQGQLVGKGTGVFIALASNVYFSKMTFGGSAGEWTAIDLEGVGDDFTTQFVTA